MKVPLFSVGQENKGTTGTDPFLTNIGPWMGVTVGIADPFVSMKLIGKRNDQICFFF